MTEHFLLYYGMYLLDSDLIDAYRGVGDLTYAHEQLLSDREGNGKKVNDLMKFVKTTALRFLVSQKSRHVRVLWMETEKMEGLEKISLLYLWSPQVVS